MIRQGTVSPQVAVDFVLQSIGRPFAVASFCWLGFLDCIIIYGFSLRSVGATLPPWQHFLNAPFMATFVELC